MRKLHGLFFILFFLIPYVHGSAVIGVYDIYRDFNSHDPVRAVEQGFPKSPILVEMKLTRDNIFAAPVAHVTYKKSQQSTAEVAEAPLQIINSTTEYFTVRIALSQHGEEASSCGPKDLKTLYVVMNIGVQGDFVSGQRVLGIRESTEDDCHIPVKTEEFSYSIDE